MATPKKVTKKAPAKRKPATKAAASAKRTTPKSKPARKASASMVSPYEMRIQAMVMLFTALSLVFAIMAVFKYS